MVDDPIFPFDPSDVSDLPSGDASQIASVSERGKWVAGGSPTDAATSGVWEDDGDGFGGYWSIVRNSTWADNTRDRRMPSSGVFPDGMNQFTVSFWMRETIPGRFSNIEFYLIDDSEENYAYVETWAGWVAWQLTVDGIDYGYFSEYITQVPLNPQH